MSNTFSVYQCQYALQCNGYSYLTIPTPCTCKLEMGSVTAVAVKFFATARGYRNVRHSYTDSLDRKPKRGKSSQSLICSQYWEMRRLAVSSTDTSSTRGNAVRTSYSSRSSHSLLHSCVAPFQFAKKISSNGRKRDARYSKPTSPVPSREGLVLEIGIVIGRFLRIACDLQSCQPLLLRS
jgi:hypothetical protein